MPHKFERVQPGQPISARLWNQLADEIERLGTIRGDNLISVHDEASGIGLTAQGITDVDLWIQPTAVGADGYHYAWQQKVPLAGGGWANGPTSGTTSSNPAQEFNANVNVNLSYVYPAWIVSTGEVRFQSDTC